MGKSKKDWLEESDRWDRLSVQELFAMSEPVEQHPADRRPRKAISLRVEEALIDEAKQAASEFGIGYQTLFRMWLIEGLGRYRRARLGVRPAAGKGQERKRVARKTPRAHRAKDAA